VIPTGTSSKVTLTYAVVETRYDPDTLSTTSATATASGGDFTVVFFVLRGEVPLLRPQES